MGEDEFGRPVMIFAVGRMSFVDLRHFPTCILGILRAYTMVGCIVTRNDCPYPVEK